MITPRWSTLDRGDATIEYCRWSGDDDPRGVVLIAHGAAEHAARYTRFASLLVADGLTVYAVDHRGHGRTAANHGAPGVARPGGWNAMGEDLVALATLIADTHAGLPLILFGHSMGSLLAQGVIQRHGTMFTGVILSGTSGAIEGADDLLPVLSAIETDEGPDAPSAMFAGMFAGFNESFAASVDEPTGYEWLSRDPDEVRTYVDDPWCGGDLSNGFVTDMITGMAEMWAPGAEDGIPADLPILLIAGDADPVGDNGAAVRALATRYEAMGRGPVSLILYPEARHEVLNETNRDQVHGDLRDWIGQRLGSAR